MLSSNGTRLMKEKDGTTHRWVKHFDNLQSRLSTVDPSAVDQIPQKSIHEELGLLPSVKEVKKATKKDELWQSTRLRWNSNADLNICRQESY